MRRVLALVAMALALAGCAHKRRTSYPAVPVKIGHTETGIASWYGRPYDGRQAANGEIYNMETMVAAHKTMPFETWVRVTNLTNRKTVDVRIIDRGPFINHRIIDLSHAAASTIDMLGPGTAKVRLVVIRPPVTASAALPPATPARGALPKRVASSSDPVPAPGSPAVAPPPLGAPVPAGPVKGTSPKRVASSATDPALKPAGPASGPTPLAATVPAAPVRAASPKRDASSSSDPPLASAPLPAIAVPSPPPSPLATFSVQVGVFRDRGNAERMRSQMEEEFGIARIVPQGDDPILWRVLVGAEPTSDAADTLAVRVRSKSGEKNAFVVRLDPQQ